ncbi:MAG: hypothetical protein FWB74_07590, partial [Defluviitaleaceae bacterium]|nr:hypothetical protein [Defluviitaleaceae bacterium]
MDAGSIIFAAMFWVFAVLFAVISLWIRRRVKPIHFYTFKDPPKPEELSSVADYNRENAKMWAVCAVLWGASGIVSLFSLAVGGAL